MSKEMNTFIDQGRIKLITGDHKHINNVTKDYISILQLQN